MPDLGDIRNGREALDHSVLGRLMCRTKPYHFNQPLPLQPHSHTFEENPPTYMQVASPVA